MPKMTIQQPAETANVVFYLKETTDGDGKRTILAAKVQDGMREKDVNLVSVIHATGELYRPENVNLVLGRLNVFRCDEKGRVCLSEKRGGTVKPTLTSFDPLP